LVLQLPQHWHLAVVVEVTLVALAAVVVVAEVEVPQYYVSTTQLLLWPQAAPQAQVLVSKVAADNLATHQDQPDKQVLVSTMVKTVVTEAATVAVEAAEAVAGVVATAVHRALTIPGDMLVILVAA
jgi:hypothetical protein